VLRSSSRKYKLLYMRTKTNKVSKTQNTATAVVITYSIVNNAEQSKNKTKLAPKQGEFIGEVGAEYQSVFGSLMRDINDSWNPQFDAPVITIDGFTLSDKHTKKFKLPYLKFTAEFSVLRAEVLAEMAGKGGDHAKVNYVRMTDKTGVWQNTPDSAITMEHFAMTAIGVVRKEKIKTQFLKEDVMKAIYTPAEMEFEQRYLDYKAETRKAKRLEAQLVKSIN